MLHESFTRLLRLLVEDGYAELFGIVLVASVFCYLLTCLFFGRSVFCTGNLVKMLWVTLYVYVFLAILPTIVSECSTALSTLFFAAFLLGPVFISLIRTLFNNDEKLTRKTI